jgi:hypothetical protein
MEAGTNLVILADSILEPIRGLLGVPLVVNSAYRSKAVNRKVGGHPQSAHLEGRACDFVPKGMDCLGAFNEIINRGPVFDKLILEIKGDTIWIHVQAPRIGKEPRHKAYIAVYDKTGTPHYEEVHHG